MSRDWSRAFRRASFRGVAFWVDEDVWLGGRRVAVTNIAYGEVPVTEDMGGRETVLPVIAYVAGSAADSEAIALTSALRAPGASTLVLPMMAGRRFRCLTFERSRKKDRNGYIAFRIEFVEAGGGVAFAPVLGPEPVAAALLAGAAIVGTALREALGR